MVEDTAGVAKSEGNLQQQVAVPSAVEQEVETQPRNMWSSLPSTDSKLCILCQKKKMVSKHTAERLSHCEMDAAVARLMDAAEIRDDARVLLATGNEKSDFFAAEVCYHRSCYMAYTSKLNLKDIQNQQARCCWDKDIDNRSAADKLITYIQH